MSYLELGFSRNVLVFYKDYRKTLKEMQEVQFDNTGNFLTLFIVPDYLPLKGNQYLLLTEVEYKKLLEEYISMEGYLHPGIDQLIIGLVDDRYSSINDVLFGSFSMESVDQ